MSKILVSGLINIETNLEVDSFPIQYEPVKYPFFGITSSVSGVGYNIAKALTVLGNKVNLMSIVGKDTFGAVIKKTLSSYKITPKYVIESMKNTPQSVIIFDKKGKRQINTDLKFIQNETYSADKFDEAIKDLSIAILCNINFSRPFLEKTKKLGKIIATDVHAISNINNKYNRDFMKYADILFLSDEKLPCTPQEFAKKLMNKFGNGIIVIGLGKKGALLCVKKDNFMERISSVKTRKIVNTIGAGDALFSAFIHFYNKTKNPYLSIKKALIFASYKAGASGGAEGFLTETKLNEIMGLASQKS